MIISILANGLMPTKSEVLHYLNAAKMVVCCDGALKNYLSWRRSQVSAPTHRLAVIGDSDSLSPALLKEAQDSGIALEHHHVAEQESNDLSKAVRFAMDIVKNREHWSANSELKLTQDGSRPNYQLSIINKNDSIP